MITEIYQTGCCSESINAKFVPKVTLMEKMMENRDFFLILEGKG